MYFVLAPPSLSLIEKCTCTLYVAVDGVCRVGMCKRDDQTTDRLVLGILDASSAAGWVVWLCT